MLHVRAGCRDRTSPEVIRIAENIVRDYNTALRALKQKYPTEPDLEMELRAGVLQKLQQWADEEPECA